MRFIFVTCFSLGASAGGAQDRALPEALDHLADLNGDGDITAGEMSILAVPQSARQRAKSVLNFRAADRNGDGVLRGGEQRANADGLASEKLPEAEADGLRALMSLDRNGDG